MDDALKKIVKDTFDAVASGYDSPALRFFPAAAEHLADGLALRGDEQVLDVACGTGHASVALARRLPRGRVTALDFSSAMLAQARAKAVAAQLTNIDFVEGDMQALPWERRFDVAVCSFGIFFVPDMDAQLARIARTVKANGRVMISNFGISYMEPMRSLLVERVRAHGVVPPPQSWVRIAEPEGCRTFFSAAGLTDIQVEIEDVGYSLTGPEQWWDVVWNAGFRRMVSGLPPAEQAVCRAEHLAEVEGLRRDGAILMPVPVLFTTGRVAG